MDGRAGGRRGRIGRGGSGAACALASIVEKTATVDGSCAPNRALHAQLVAVCIINCCLGIGLWPSSIRGASKSIF